MKAAGLKCGRQIGDMLSACITARKLVNESDSIDVPTIGYKYLRYTLNYAPCGVEVLPGCVAHVVVYSKHAYKDCGLDPML